MTPALRLRAETGRRAFFTTGLTYETRCGLPARGFDSVLSAPELVPAIPHFTLLTWASRKTFVQNAVLLRIGRHSLMTFVPALLANRHGYWLVARTQIRTRKAQEYARVPMDNLG